MTESPELALAPDDALTPRAVVEALDRHIIGQAQAKRAVAVAIRNRWRRQRLEPELARDVTPKNIIMAGPTGVGKTEIARRLARLTGAPFIKVEASKFTEVGYHGRDVESMIRDLVEVAIRLVHDEQAEHVRAEAEQAVQDRLLDLLLPGGEDQAPSGGMIDTDASGEARQRLRDRLREQLDRGELEDRRVELTITRRPAAQVMLAGAGLDQLDPQMSKMFEQMLPEQRESKSLTVAEARRVLLEQETEAMLDRDQLAELAIARTEQSGMVFLDEIDKVATPQGGSGGGGSSPDISRQGVQRDLLPIVEGSQVNTRHGTVQTDHILFIAAGAFHSAKVGDLMPELQGRFPIRVELQALTRDDFVRILQEPHNALVHQATALLGAEGLRLTFEPAAVDAIAQLAAEANQRMENIGARRLATLMERVLEELSFDAPDRVAQGHHDFVVTENYVRDKVGGLVQDAELSRFVL